MFSVTILGVLFITCGKLCLRHCLTNSCLAMNKYISVVHLVLLS